METIRGLRDQKRRGEFTGREKEIIQFRDLVKEVKPGYSILSIWGVGGVGKTTLLDRMKEAAVYLDAQVAIADLHERKDAIEVLIAWRSKFEKADFQDFDQMLDKSKGIQSKIKTTLGALTDGAIGAVKQTGPIGGFAIGTFGEDQIRSWLNNLLIKPDIDFYLSKVNNLSNSFIKGLNLLANNSKIVLMLDTYEMAGQDLDDWFCSFLGLEISNRVFFVIAGRDKLEDMNPDWIEWMPIVCEREIEPFSTDETIQYLQKRGISNEQLVDKIREFTGDLPWALELTAETISRMPEILEGFPKTAKFREVERKVVSRFLSQLNQEEELGLLVETCAILEHFDQDILKHLLDGKAVHAWKSLRKFSFVRTRDDGQLMLNDTVREFIETDFRSHAPVRWRVLHGKAADYYKQLIQELPQSDPKWQNYNLDWLYHAVVVDEANTIQTFSYYCTEMLGASFNEYCSSMISVLQKRVETSESKLWLTYYKGQVDFNQARWVPAIQAMKQITDNHIAPVQLRLGAYYTLCDIYHRRGEFELVLQTAIEGLKLANVQKSPEFVALLSAAAAEIYGSQARLDESRYYCSISEQSLSEVSQPYLAGSVHIVLADIYLFRGDLDSGERNLQMALKHWETAKNKFGIARTKISLSWLYMLNGKWEYGLNACKDAEVFFSQNEDIYHIGLNETNMAEIYRLEGQTIASIEWGRKAISALNKIGSKLYESIATYQFGIALLDNSEVNEAIETLEIALSLEVEEYHIGLNLFYLALAYARANKQEQAKTYFKQSEATLAIAHNKYGFAVLHLEYCHQALATGNYDIFLSSLAKAKEIAKEYNCVDIIAKISMLQGMYELQLYTSHRGRGPDLNALEAITQEFTNALSFALFYNRYLLDHITRKIVETILRNRVDSYLKDIIWIVNRLIDSWVNTHTESGELLTDMEVRNRYMEIGDGQRQTPVLVKMEELRTILEKGVCNVTKGQGNSYHWR